MLSCCFSEITSYGAVMMRFTELQGHYKTNCHCNAVVLLTKFKNTFINHAEKIL